MRRELEAGGAEGREGDGEPEGSGARPRRVGAVGAEEEEAPLGSRGRGRRDGARGETPEGGVAPLVHLEKRRQNSRNFVRREKCLRSHES